MAIFRQYIVPFIAILMFLVALFVVSVRIFLPEDLAAPAPIEDVDISSMPIELNSNNGAFS